MRACGWAGSGNRPTDGKLRKEAGESPATQFAFELDYPYFSKGTYRDILLSILNETFPKTSSEGGCRAQTSDWGGDWLIDRLATPMKVQNNYGVYPWIMAFTRM